jgi:hypothetical protein
MAEGEGHIEGRSRFHGEGQRANETKKLATKKG